MRNPKHNQEIEKTFRQSVKRDKARTQVGRISQFGLLELSRQRLKPTILEGNYQNCPHCEGSGLVRSTVAFALSVLRQIRAEAAKDTLATVHRQAADGRGVLPAEPETQGNRPAGGSVQPDAEPGRQPAGAAERAQPGLYPASRVRGKSPRRREGAGQGSQGIAVPFRLRRCAAAPRTGRAGGDGRRSNAGGGSPGTEAGGRSRGGCAAAGGPRRGCAACGRGSRAGILALQFGVSDDWRRTTTAKRWPPRPARGPVARRRAVSPGGRVAGGGGAAPIQAASKGAAAQQEEAAPVSEHVEAAPE